METGACGSFGSAAHQGTQETLQACSGSSSLETREAADDPQGPVLKKQTALLS